MHGHTPHGRQTAPQHATIRREKYRGGGAKKCCTVLHVCDEDKTVVVTRMSSVELQNVRMRVRACVCVHCNNKWLTRPS